MTPEAIITEHVVDTLPGDIDGRIKVLRALAAILPVGTEQRRHVVQSLTSLNLHLQLQTEFRSMSAARGSGRLSDRPVARGSSRLSDRPLARGGMGLRPGAEYWMRRGKYTQRVWVFRKSGELYWQADGRPAHPVASVPDACWQEVSRGAR